MLRLFVLWFSYSLIGLNAQIDIGLNIGIDGFIGGDEKANHIFVVDDGFILLNKGFCPNEFISCFELMKTDFEGNIIWQHIYDTEEKELFIRGYTGAAIMDEEQNIILTGTETTFASESSSGEKESRIFLMKFNSEGDSLWKKTYEYPLNTATDIIWNVGESLTFTHDDNYLLSCFVVTAYDSTDYLVIKSYLLKTDTNGNVLWGQIHSHQEINENRTRTVSVNLDEDGGFILSGRYQYDTLIVESTSDYPVLIDDTYILKTDSLGNKLWENLYGYRRYDNCGGQNIQPLKNESGYVMHSCLPKDTTFQHEFFFDIQLPVRYSVVRLDSLGNTVWDHLFEADQAKIIWSITQSIDGNYIYGAGQDNNYNNTPGYPWIGWIFKMDLQGNLIWEKQIASLEHPAFEGSKIYYLEEIQEGILAGVGQIGRPGTTPANQGTDVTWLFTLDTDGCAIEDCNDSLIYLNFQEPYDNLLIGSSAEPIQVYPNPTANYFNIWSSLSTEINDAQFFLYDLTGQVLLTQNIENKKVDVSNLSNGLYLYRFYDKEQHLLKQGKLLIQK